MSEENVKREDYIDLPPVKKITVYFLRFIFSIVDLLFGVLKKSKILLLLGMIAGLAAGFVYYSSRPVYFDVSMVAQSSTVLRRTLAEMVENLNRQIISQSYNKLAAELAISTEHAKQIKHIELTGLMDEPLRGDTSSKFSLPFKINARINNTELTDTFQNAIVNYLNNKPSLKNTNEQEVKYYNEKLSFIEKEIAKLDTLKTAYNRFFSSSKITTTYYSNDVDPAGIYKQANNLYDEKGSIIIWLSANSNPIQDFDEFKSPSLPQSYSRFKSMVSGLLIGLGICYLLGLYLDLYQKTRQPH